MEYNDPGNGLKHATDDSFDHALEASADASEEFFGTQLDALYRVASELPDSDRQLVDELRRATEEL